MQTFFIFKSVNILRPLRYFNNDPTTIFEAKIFKIFVFRLVEERIDRGLSSGDMCSCLKRELYIKLFHATVLFKRKENFVHILFLFLFIYFYFCLFYFCLFLFLFSAITKIDKLDAKKNVAEDKSVNPEFRRVECVFLTSSGAIYNYVHFARHIRKPFSLLYMDFDRSYVNVAKY